MMDKIIIDADLCIKMGGSNKYRYLYEVLPLVADEIYMHTYAYGEVMMPSSAVNQLRALVSEGKVCLVSESSLSCQVRATYDGAYYNLARVMLDPERPNKNRGEISSLAYAKAVGIPIFATDERELQPIIDKQLNTGIDDITCIRIVDIVVKAKNKEIEISRRVCKALWVIAGKNKEIFDKEIWPM
ncbi:hypothetical protein GN277_04800 [Lachnospiraceae bacterium WCA-9-b2]|uniref:PIN domain-containing protein n=1 Tax=Sporofaciens musculi TaxID=2681861 RepID=A0A7X3ME16_9FIRM|nr:hypothetical protein [Sporofaciens musculi]MXP74719.1 hypothetical protein [Sporofaciens musculi]